MTNYQSIRIDIFRENTFSNSVSENLNYLDGIADFNFSIPIVSELANYSLKIYGENSGMETLEREINDIVAGDVYIILGQSNAEARMFNGDADIYQNNFIRVFAGGYDTSSNLLNNMQWSIGQGNGNRNTLGNTGQWGLKLANTIVNSANIPVAIFNGGHGGKEINFFLAPSNYQTSLSSNYGRLYRRLNTSGLKDHVRAGILGSRRKRFRCC